MAGPTGTLICPSVAGVGKTFLTAIVVDALRKRFAAHAGGGVAVLYCSYQQCAKHTAATMLAALLRQLLLLRGRRAEAGDAAAALLEPLLTRAPRRRRSTSWCRCRPLWRRRVCLCSSTHWTSATGRSGSR